MGSDLGRNGVGLWGTGSDWGGTGSDWGERDRTGGNGVRLVRNGVGLGRNGGWTSGVGLGGSDWDIRGGANSFGPTLCL